MTKPTFKYAMCEKCEFLTGCYDGSDCEPRYISPECSNTTHEMSPEALGKKFNEENSIDFQGYLRYKIKENPTIRFNILADWKDIHKARAAKGIMDSGRYHIDSFGIKATRSQYLEDVNAFQSGVKWVKI